MNSLEALQLLTAEPSDPSSLPQLLRMFCQDCGKRAEAALIQRMISHYSPPPQNHLIEEFIQNIHPNHANIRTIWNMLNSSDILSREESAFIDSLFRRQEYFQFNERLLADFAFRLHKTRNVAIADFALPGLKPFARSSRLYTAILVVAACSAAVPDPLRVVRLARFRSRRFRMLADLIWNPRVSTKDQSSMEKWLKRVLEMSDIEQRSLLFDVYWICTRANSDLYKAILNAATTLPEAGNCELLVPLLVRRSNKQSVGLLAELAHAPSARLSRMAALALQQD